MAPSRTIPFDVGWVWIALTRFEPYINNWLKENFQLMLGTIIW